MPKTHRSCSSLKHSQTPLLLAPFPPSIVRACRIMPRFLNIQLSPFRLQITPQPQLIFPSLPHPSSGSIPSIFLPAHPPFPCQYYPIQLKTIIIAMSMSEDRIKFLDVYQSHQDSFFKDHEEDADIPPQELSADQNGQQSLISTIHDKGKANFLLTVTTIIKTVIGSGILGLPYTVSKCGYAFAIIVFVIATVVTQLGSILLLKAKNLSGHSNFSTILYHLYQNKWCKGIGSILILLNNLGICILEIIIFKTTIRKLLEDTLKDSPTLNDFYTDEIAIALLILVLEIPSIMVSKIEKLRFMAFIGVSGIFIFVSAFVGDYIITSKDFVRTFDTVDMDIFPENWFSAIASIPNLLLALSFHMNFFPVFKGMRNANDRKMALATMSGIIVCSIFYLLLGILGYHLVHTMKGTEVKANFLQSLPYEQTNPILYFIINIGFLLSVFFAFPIMFFGCRNNFIALMQLLLLPSEKNQKIWRDPSQNNIQKISSYISSKDRVDRRRKARRWFVFYTFGIYLVIAGVSISVDNIAVVFNVIGAVCSTSIGVLLPCFFYFQLIRMKNKPRHGLFYLTIVLFSVMIPFALFSLVAQYL